VLGQRVVETIDEHKELGFTVMGLLTRRTEKVGTTIKGKRVLGMMLELGEVLDREQVDQVILALPLEDQPHPQRAHGAARPAHRRREDGA
jgi:FlaA1/EpsC-like NDP-sugar epimerase